MRDYVTDYNDILEQTKFIHTLQNCNLILEKVRYDRKNDDGMGRYTSGLFFETIRKIVNELQKGIVLAPGTVYTDSYTSSSTNSSRPRRSSTSRHTSSSSSKFSTRSNKSAASHLRQLKQLQVFAFDVTCLDSLLEHTPCPSDPAENEPLLALEIAIKSIDKDLNRYTTFPCAVCNNKGHTFQDCPMLQNTPVVRQAYGKLRAYLNKFKSVADKLNLSLEDTRKLPTNSLQQYQLIAPSNNDDPTVHSGLSGLTQGTNLYSVHPSTTDHMSTHLTSYGNEDTDDSTVDTNNQDF